MSSVTVDPARIRTIPDPGEPVPRLNWPTILLLLGGVAVFVASTTLALTGTWPWWPSVILNAIAAFVLFTVSHEASHHSASSRRDAQHVARPARDAVLRPARGLSHVALHPHAAPPVHEPRRRQRPRPLHPPRRPLDAAAALADDRPLVRRLLRPKMLTRPRGEIVEAVVTWVVLLSIAALAIVTGSASRCSSSTSCRSASPCSSSAGRSTTCRTTELTATPEEDRFRTTRNRIGLRAPALPAAALPELPPRPSPAPGGAVLPLHRGLATLGGRVPRRTTRRSATCAAAR